MKSSLFFLSSFLLLASPTAVATELDSSNELKSKTELVSFWDTDKDYDQKTGDIIDKEMDEYGNMRDCTRGKSSNRRKLPSCNDIIDRRQDALERDAKKSNKFMSNKLSGNNLFVLPNGSKIRVTSAVKYNDETQSGRGGGELIINAEVERVNANLESFENLFIRPGSRLVISFLDSDNFELLDALNVPLHIQTGLTNNIKYRKRVGQTTDDLVAIKIQARLPIRSVREYQQIKRISVSAKFRN